MILIKIFFLILTSSHIKNANSLMLFQFYVSESYYFHLCKCDILMGGLVFSFAGKKIPGDPREHGAQTCACHFLPVCWLLGCVWLFAGPVDCSPPGSSVTAIPQARTLEWVATSFSREAFWPRDRTRVSCTAGGFLSHLSLQGNLAKITPSLHHGFLSF